MRGNAALIGQETPQEVEPLFAHSLTSTKSSSRMPFVRAYFRETQELVFDAHDKAFLFYGGVCRRGIYDNMKRAVDVIFVGKARQVQSPLSADVLASPDRTGGAYAGVGLGEGTGRESSRQSA